MHSAGHGLEIEAVRLFDDRVVQSRSGSVGRRLETEHLEHRRRPVDLAGGHVHLPGGQAGETDRSFQAAAGVVQRRVGGAPFRDVVERASDPRHDSRRVVYRDRVDGDPEDFALRFVHADDLVALRDTGAPGDGAGVQLARPWAAVFVHSLPPLVAAGESRYLVVREPEHLQGRRVGEPDRAVQVQHGQAGCHRLEHCHRLCLQLVARAQRQCVGQPLGTDVGEHGEQLHVLLVERIESGRVGAEQGDDLGFVDEGHHQEGHLADRQREAGAGVLEPVAADLAGLGADRYSAEGAVDGDRGTQSRTVSCRRPPARPSSQRSAARRWRRHIRAPSTLSRRATGR